LRILPIVHSHSLCMWRWPIRKEHLDSSFHLKPLPSSISKESAFVLVVLFFFFAVTPYRRDPIRSTQLSTVAILCFQFGLYHIVVIALSFLRGNQPCFIVISKGRLAHLRHAFATGVDEPCKCTTPYDLVHSCQEDFIIFFLPVPKFRSTTPKINVVLTRL